MTNKGIIVYANYQAEIMFFHTKRTHYANLLLTFWQYRGNKRARSK